MAPYESHTGVENLMEIVLAAATTGFFAVVVAVVQKSRKENKTDHGMVMGKLDHLGHEIRKDIRQVRYELNAQREDLRSHMRNDH